MSAFFNSWVFLAVKAALAAGVAAILGAAASGDATIPVWLAPILAALSGVLQVGQKKLQ
jgi:hypothetical protein